MANLNQKAKKKKASSGTSGLPNWLLSTLVIIVVLAVIGTCVATACVSNGVAMKLSTAVSLNDLKVNGNMMSYFYQSTYMNFMETYSSYASYFGYDTKVDPRLQTFNDTAKSTFRPQDECATWHDYFISETKASVKNLLIYCAEAEKLGITLDKEDKKNIEADIDTLVYNIRISFNEPSLPEATCFAEMYGTGVTRSDIRKAMKLSTLASKAAEQISNTLIEAVTDERIDTTYNENVLDYNLVDYITYSFDVSYDEVISDKYGTDKTAENLTDDEKKAVLELYTSKIAEAHAAAEELKSKTTLDDFRNWIINYEAKNDYDDQFESAMKKITDDQKPKAAEGEADPLVTIKDKTIEAVIKEVTEGKEAVTEDVVMTEVESNKTYTLYGISITSEFAEAAKTLKKNLFDAVVSTKDDAIKKKVNYIAPTSDDNKDEFSEWAFHADRKANDTTNIETGDGANAGTVEVKTERFTAEVSLMLQTSYRDETLSRNVAYMLFTKEEAAKKALEAIEATEELTKEKFLAIADDANNPADAKSDLKDYIVGNMGSEAFDEWLFNAAPNTYSPSIITMSDGSMMLAYYESEGTIPAWKDTVKSNLYNEDYTAYEERMMEEFKIEVVFNDEVIQKRFS